MSGTGGGQHMVDPDRGTGNTGVPGNRNRRSTGRSRVDAFSALVARLAQGNQIRVHLEAGPGSVHVVGEQGSVGVSAVLATVVILRFAVACSSFPLRRRVVGVHAHAGRFKALVLRLTEERVRERLHVGAVWPTECRHSCR